MPGETNLRDRWQRAFRSSSEYQNALKRDAIAKVTRTRQAREAMHAALMAGDTRKASAIQQSLLDGNSQPGEATAGLDAFQNQRATDYITQAEQRGQEQANTARSGPLAGVANGPGYYAGLENPDFATHFPYGELAPKVWIGMEGQNPPTSRESRGRGVAAVGNPSGTTPAPINPVTGDEQLRTAAQGADALQTAMRRERDLLSTLPDNLRAHYQKLYPPQSAGGGQGLDAPMSRSKFLAMTPEQQSAALNVSYGKDYARSQYGKRPMSSGAIIRPGGQQSPPDVLQQRNPGINLGPFAGGGVTIMSNPQYSEDVPNTDRPVTRPVTNSRPTSTLVKPPDYLDLDRARSRYLEDAQITKG